MWKFFILCLPALLGLTAALHADDFEDFEQAAATVALHYNRAIDSKGTRFESEYRQHMDSMCEYGAKVQNVIRNLELGKDLNISDICKEIRTSYEANNRDFSGSKEKRQNLRKKMEQHAQDPSKLFQLLADDIKTLKKMQFSTENGGSIRETLKTKRRLLAYERVFRFFLKHQKACRSRDADVALMRIFEYRISIMQQLASEVDRYIRVKNPNAMLKVNLAEETEIMLRNFKQLRSSQGKKSTYKVKQLGGSTTVNALSSEMNVAIQNIQRFLIELKNADMETDPPLRQTVANTKKNTASAQTTVYESMKETELAAELMARRKKIYRANTSLDGVDREVLNEYLTSLSRDQRQMYNKYQKEYAASGYSSDQAVRSALLQLHTRLCNEQTSMTKKEMITALKKLDALQKKKEKDFEPRD